MRRLLLIAFATLCLGTPAWAGTAFQHIILVVQENRTPDNLFYGLCADPNACAVPPAAGQYDIQTSAWFDNTSAGGTTDPHPVSLGIGYGLGHSHQSFLAMCDFNGSGACAMDGAAHVKCVSKTQPCPPEAAFGYVDNSDGSVQPYLDLVHAYGWGNYMFQTNQGPSLPAHQYLFGATSAPSADDDHAGTFAAENGGKSDTSGTGCAAKQGTSVPLINAEGQEFTKVFPCFEHQTLSDLLEAQSVSWRYYGANPNGLWMAPNAIAHICVVRGKKCSGSEWNSNVDLTPSDVLSDISSKCALRGVSWVTPDGANSDHADNVKTTGGPSWVASIVDAVGSSTCKNPDGTSYWDSTAIIITWDDWGGWYDHEAPTIEAFPQGGYQMGFRVPLIVVSALTPAGFISNSPEDFGSIGRFIEQNFAIAEGALTFADARATGDLSEFFPSGAPVRKFQPIRAALSAADFLNAKPSSIPVDDD
ncbi:MAG TPA: alkaline phosphatase family protein [Rhizomicrobium sp.]|nr:alkaline phosphatase family protein [Rhizomicrobium sp.]